MTLTLSLLDQSPIGRPYSAADALAQTIDLAQAAEGLGYHRYWLAEHHHSPGFAGSAPEILAALVLERTTRIRVGSGGVLLPRYRAEKVAEVFGVLAAVHPGRVDLGVGRAGGPPQDFPRKFSELRALLHDHQAGPGTPCLPDLWLLGASAGSAALAAEMGTGFAFGHFLRPEPSVRAVDAYLRGHVPTVISPAPKAAVAVRVVVAKTAERAEALTDSLLLWRSRKDHGHDAPFPTPQDTASHRWSSLESAARAAHRHGLFVGTPDHVAADLRIFADKHHVEELIINTPLACPADRLRSYELLARQVTGVDASPSCSFSSTRAGLTGQGMAN